MAKFIAAQRAEYGVPHALACRALGVSQAWFYKWRHGDGSPRRARRRALEALIAVLFARHRGSYGAPRITADLREMGWRVSQNTVAAVMAEQGLRARAKRRRRSTTRPGKVGIIRRLVLGLEVVEEREEGVGRPVSAGCGAMRLDSGERTISSSWSRVTARTPRHCATR